MKDSEDAAKKRDQGHRSRIIGRRAQAAARKLFEDMELMPRREDEDDGEDLVLEVVNGLGQIERVLVQIKGSESWASSSEAAWNVPVRANAIGRYRQLAHPIFLVAVDLATEEIRWLHLDPLLGNTSNPKTRRFAMPVTARINVEDAEAFKTALRVAADSRRLGAVPKSLAEHERELEASDPRFIVRAIANARGMSYELRARVPVAAAFQVKAERAAAEAFAHAVGHGRPATLAVASIAASGSPLFAALNQKAGFLTLTGNAREVSGSLGWIDQAGTFQPAYDSRFTVHHGHQGLSLDVESDGAPFHVELEGTYGQNKANLQFTLDLAPWLGRPLRAVPYLDQTAALFEALVGGAPMAFAERRYGKYERVQPIPSSDELRSYAASVLGVIRLVQAIARVSQRFAPDILFQGTDLQNDEFQSLVILDSVVRTGSSAVDSIAATVHLVEGGELPPNKTPDDVIVTADLTLQLWGREVALVPIVMVVPEFDFTGPTSSGEYMLRSRPGTQAHIHLAADAQSRNDGTE